MRYVTFRQGEKISIGIVNGENSTITVLSQFDGDPELGIVNLIESTKAPEPTGVHVELGAVTLLAPIPRPRRNIICVGKNYVEHAHEFSGSGFDSGAAQGAIPSAPIVFSKLPETVVAHGDNVIIDPTVSKAIDYEAELCVIIGKGGRGISRASALDHVWGYTIVNDVTARDLQKLHSQWLIGKSQDSFCPMGPIAVTRDELDLGDTAVRCWVNNDLRQSSNTSALIFDVPELISTISRGITLYPGDLIATGTPAGVGIGFSPPRYLQSGDVVRVEIEGIGVLENMFVSSEERLS
ncbi:fumarylacetoacetate hydrolase family protein [Haliea sp. E1-2-M8]|uniref:fumarylacetoacetate hydrolase family protein n=1 Tax=Haliea sp. E1-2-M8 TaxID=3064706 RepID=UPI00272149F1|nr:fumarylacetoacetate hydrolase family protein [Haliea sp. E1-2-M8]MDO8863798.1 fumarylacetoacetate hydrolase family protein [Haliea sp. E1-2-M8]